MAARDAGLRFGAYYSGGPIGASELPAIGTHAAGSQRPAPRRRLCRHAYLHVKDLVDRYQPDILWHDIEWPDAGKHGLSLGLFELMDHDTGAVPEGSPTTSGATPRDYKTSEYQFHLDSEQSAVWEHCRGIGLSFAYNREESVALLLDGTGSIRPSSTWSPAVATFCSTSGRRPRAWSPPAKGCRSRAGLDEGRPPRGSTAQGQ